MGTVGGPSTIANEECPAMTLVSISLLLLYEIATPGIPLFSFKSSVVMVKAGEVVA
jgi:hypothetical protein